MHKIISSHKWNIQNSKFPYVLRVGVHCSYLRVEMDNFGWSGPCGGKLVPNPRTRELTGRVQCHNRIIKEVRGVMPLESMAKPYQTETPAHKLCKQQTSTADTPRPI